MVSARYQRFKPIRTHPLTAVEVAWAAGFLEGEGCFKVTCPNPIIVTTQKEREPLDRLQAAFGGTIARPSSPSQSGPIYRLTLSGTLAVQAMMTVYGLMSTRRQKAIRIVLKKWKASNSVRSSTMRLHNLCPRGGAYHTVRQYGTQGQRRCVECRIEWTRRWRARKKLELAGTAPHIIGRRKIAWRNKW